MMLKAKNTISLIAVGLLCLFCILLTACAPKAESVSLDQEIKYEDICTLKVPSDWSNRGLTDDGAILVDMPDGGLLTISGYNINNMLDKGYVSDDDIETFVNEFYEGLYEAGDIKPLNSSSSNNHNLQLDTISTTAKDEVTYTDDSGVTYKGICYLKAHGSNVGCLLFFVPESKYSDAETVINSVIASLDVEFANTVDTARTGKERDDAIAKLDSSSTESNSSSTVTKSQSNAVKMAKDYLAYSAFSYKGLVEQLEYEGFSKEDATYGADKCGADWNAQAARMAQQYLDYSAFSRKGLIDQLKYEGFTTEQATYGVNSVGL